MLYDHIRADTTTDALMWWAAVALWLTGVVLVVYFKLRAIR